MEPIWICSSNNLNTSLENPNYETYSSMGRCSLKAVSPIKILADILFLMIMVTWPVHFGPWAALPFTSVSLLSVQLRQMANKTGYKYICCTSGKT